MLLYTCGTFILNFEALRFQVQYLILFGELFYVLFFICVSRYLFAGQSQFYELMRELLFWVWIVLEGHYFFQDKRTKTFPQPS